MSVLPPPPPGAQPAPVVTRSRRAPLVLTAVISLLAGISGVFIGAALNSGGGSGSAEPAPPIREASTEPFRLAPPRTEPGSDNVTDVAALIEQVGPSVVSISTDIAGGDFPSGASGTGVVITTDGEILTNAHVVEGATAIRVRLAGETEPVAATLLAADAGNDLALLRIDRAGLPAATFADPDSIAIGQEVVAIGFALDLDGEPTITRGIISATNRSIQTSSGILNSMIQTDAAISSGNSGGPLVNAAGEVVGINTAVARGGVNSQASNIGFAISSDEVGRVVESLRRSAGGPAREEGYLGVSLAPRSDGGRGAIITEVQVGTPAARAGVRVGDVVVSIDDVAIDGTLALIAAVRDREPGDVIELVVVRDGQTVQLQATLEARPDS